MTKTPRRSGTERMAEEGGGPISKIFSETLRRLIPGIACLVLSVIWSHPALALDGFPFSRENPQNVVGAEACAECIY